MESTKLFTPDAQISKSKEKRENILVHVRVRPVNAHERSKNALLVLDCPGTREVVVRERNGTGVSKTFTFDRVFGPHSKQIDVYKTVVSPLLEEVLLGYNCTVFAYGQTGTGKTFTMEGERSTDETNTWESDPLAGIVPRAMSQLFDELRVTNSEFTVRVSLVEMYNEEVYCLLSPTEDGKPKTVRLYDDASRKGSVVIHGLEEVIVHNKHEVYSIMERGSQMRKTASTLLNANSSRSHTVFTVTVHIKEASLLSDDLVKIGKLHLVDLAGSENIGRSGAVDKRAREAGNINQSLLTLGRVITALVERAPHVPYRESKLTRLLQDSLGGKTKTSIIATVSPASINIEETLSTLDYAHRAKNIQNRPEVNQKMTKKAMMREYTEEIERLRRDLTAAREKNGIYVDKDNYDTMMSQIESQGQDLGEKIQYTRSLEEKVETKEREFLELQGVLLETKEDLDNANTVIKGLQNIVSQLQSKLKETENEKDEIEHLVTKHSETEVKLTTEAQMLLNTATESTVNLESLHSRLERKKNVEATNLEAGKRFRTDFDAQLKNLAGDVTSFRQEHTQFSAEQRLILDGFLERKENNLAEIQENLVDFSHHMKTLVDNLREGTLKIQSKLAEECQKDRDFTAAAKNDLFNQCDFVAVKTDDIRQRLLMQSGKMSEFWDSTYLIDLPTGATPQRKAYDYPTTLSATSPHNKILERFRLFKFKIDAVSVEGTDTDPESSPRIDGSLQSLSGIETPNSEDELSGRDENKDPREMEFENSSDKLENSTAAMGPPLKSKAVKGPSRSASDLGNPASNKTTSKSTSSGKSDRNEPKRLHSAKKGTKTSKVLSAPNRSN